MLTKIQIVLTTLVVVAFVVGMRMAAWLHSMATLDPVRQEWQSKFDRIGSTLVRDSCSVVVVHELSCCHSWQTKASGLRLKGVVAGSASLCSNTPFNVGRDAYGPRKPGAKELV